MTKDPKPQAREMLEELKRLCDSEGVALRMYQQMVFQGWRSKEEVQVLVDALENNCRCEWSSYVSSWQGDPPIAPKLIFKCAACMALEKFRSGEAG